MTSQSCINGLFVDDVGSGIVEQHGAVVEVGELLIRDHVYCVVFGRYMHCQVVGILTECIEVINSTHAVRKFPCMLYREVRVVAIHIHTKIDKGVGDLGSDGAKTDDGHLATNSLSSYEGFLCGFSALGYRWVLFVGAYPAHALHGSA